MPAADVVCDDCVNVAPLSTENESGIPLSAWPDAVVAVAVALTVAAPVFWMLFESSCSVRLDAETHVAGALAADAPDEAQPAAALPVPNGGVPASSSPPPHDARPIDQAGKDQNLRMRFSCAGLAGGLRLRGASARRRPVGDDLGRQEDQQLGLGETSSCGS